ncbi:DUF6776 family protein [uncultured Marinobacter sp.]|uniref:DUF6776 family protein n=1 Tax=uncultured Marinobacter sp. TaxID=187379 RepID=UPI0030DC87EB
MSGQFVIVRRRRADWFWRVSLVILMTLFGVAAGYMIGLSETGYEVDDMAQTRQSLARELSTVKSDYAEARQALVRLERSQAIDQQALKVARENITELETRIMALEGDLTFYRKIMAPSEVRTGLQVDQLSLKEVRGERRYGFRFVLTQIGDNSSFIAGHVAVNLIGEQNGEPAAIPLRDVSEDIEDLGIRFRFRYFQDVEGVMVLPEDFTPFEIEVVATAEGAKASRAEKTFEWLQLTEN